MEKKIRNSVTSALDFGHGFAKFPLTEKNGRLGARIHHEHVRPELLQAPRKILAISVFVDESEQVEIPLRIAHHAFEIVDLKQTQVAMIILDAFLLQFRTLLRGKLVSLT